MTARPYHSALYSSIARNSAQAASEIARARLWFLTILRTGRSSMTCAPSTDMVTGTIFPGVTRAVSLSPELQDAPRQHPGQVRVPDQGVARLGHQRLVPGPGAL